jgi:hypothetical protein
MKRLLLPGVAMLLMGGMALPNIAVAAPVGFTQQAVQTASGPSLMVQHVDYYYRNGHRYWRKPPPPPRHHAEYHRPMPAPRRDDGRP